MGAPESEKPQPVPEKATVAVTSAAVAEKHPQAKAGSAEQSSSKGDYIFDENVKLVMREGSSWISDQFRISTASGQELLMLNSKPWHLFMRKELRSPQSNELLFTLRKGLGSFFESYYLQDKHGSEVVRIDCRWSYSRAQFDVKFINRAAESKAGGVVITTDGTWLDRCQNVMWEGQRVARLDRKLAGSGKLWGPLTFGLEVAAGMDVSLVVAIVLVLDRRRQLATADHVATHIAGAA